MKLECVARPEVQVAKPLSNEQGEAYEFQQQYKKDPNSYLESKNTQHPPENPNNSDAS